MPSPSPTPKPSPLVRVARLHWTKTVTNLPRGVVQTGVTALAMRPGKPPTYLAISADHRVWISTDGIRWRRGGDMASAEGGNVWWVRQLLVMGSTFVALGASAILEDSGQDGPYSGIVAGYAWTSRDGETWDRTELPSFSAHDVILDDGQFVAAGGLTSQYAPTFATSPDGKTWNRIEVPGDPWPATAGQFPWPTIGSLSGSRSGGYDVLVRPYPFSDEDCQGAGIAPVPIVWRSADLRSWQPATRLVDGCATPQQLVSGPAGQVAMRESSLQDSNTRPIQAWRSTDGSTWTDVAQLPGPVAYLGSLAIAPDGTFLAIGNGIWESVDGADWTLSAPARGLRVEEFAGDLAIACGDTTCSALRLR